MSKTISKTISVSQYDSICNDVQNRCQSGEKVTLSGLSKQHNCTMAEMREILTDHFGTRISFLKGRGGGIRVL